MNLKIILIPLLGLISFSLSAQLKGQLEKEIGKIIYYDTEITFKATPAYLIGVQLGDSSYVFPYGYTSKTNESAPQSDHLFEIGGLSKSFTALLSSILMNEGLIHPDSSINFYLPKQFQNPTANQVTVLDLIQHTTELPRLPIGIGLKEKDPSNPFGHYTKHDLLTYYSEVDFGLIKSKSFKKNQKKQYKYSHTNYGILEVILEQVSDQSYERLLRKYIFQPCGMDQSGVHDFTAENRNKIVKGHTLGGQPTAPWQMRSFAGSEGIKSSMDDLLKYMRASLKNKTHRLGSILAHNQQPLVKTDMAKHIYGETGVIILANSPHSMNGLGLLILRMINNNWKRTKKGLKTNR